MTHRPGVAALADGELRALMEGARRAAAGERERAQPADREKRVAPAGVGHLRAAGARVGCGAGHDARAGGEAVTCLGGLGDDGPGDERGDDDVDYYS